MTSLEVAGLAKSFGSQPVLSGLDLVAGPGSFTCILGPSGSGKTTLLRAIAGFERADRGTIRLGDRVVDDGGELHVPAQARGIGYVPQEGGLFPHLSVSQNVAFGLPRRERRGARVGELLEMVGLAGLERRFPHQLSGGQQQRVALARALAIRPELVLLDEPFASLDAGLRASVRRDVRRVLREAGTTALLVTHDQDEAFSLADSVAIIRDGRIGQCAPAREIYTRPSSAEIARGLGETNFVPGTASGSTADTPLGSLSLENDLHSTGAALMVLVRPEQISLVCPGSLEFGNAHSRDSHAATGQVVEAEYYGHDAVVRLRPSWDPSSTLVARVSDAATLPETGSHVGISAFGCAVAWAAEPGAGTQRGGL